MSAKLGAIVAVCGVLFATTTTTTPTDCKCTPHDSCWPSPQVWDELNRTVSGRLVRSTPLAAACHNPSFDAKACANIQALWDLPQFHINSSSSIQAAQFAGNPCDPFKPRSASCTLGKEVQYAIAVSCPEDVAAGIAFTKKHNIRLVTRNTGHDLLGKSTGYGALAVWMHHLNNMEFMENYQSPHYNGSAAKLGAGVEVGDVYRATAKHGKVVVGGECHTVGLAGGYSQGGGHSPLSSLLGMAADSVLAFEAVTADGKFIKVDATTHSDLLWALSGGGAGTYAVTTSITIKTHEDFPVTGSMLSFNTSPTVSLDTWWEAVSFYSNMTMQFTAAGAIATTIYSLPGNLTIGPLFAPKLTSKETHSLLNPLLDKLSQLGIPYDLDIKTFPTFFPAYSAFYGELVTATMQFGGRLISIKVMREEGDKLTDTLRELVDEGATVIDIAMAPTFEVAGPVDNAVLPAWRDIGKFLLITQHINSSTTPEVLDAQAKRITAWDAKLPSSSTYLNEADPFEPKWQEVFYGDNYGKLLSIKKKYDPEHVFYARTAVGSEAWEEMADGRLCRTRSTA